MLSVVTYPSHRYNTIQWRRLALADGRFTVVRHPPSGSSDGGVERAYAYPGSIPLPEDRIYSAGAVGLGFLLARLRQASRQHECGGGSIHTCRPSGHLGPKKLADSFLALVAAGSWQWQSRR